ncbi:MAG: ATP-binding protein [Candidatus Pelagadaptatus aseana]|uniref:ATP-binding protein n=1 Tax=Candidatus Pelagadaptatus aseana TaxID=3120508 RepID=UPI0039B30874
MALVALPMIAATLLITLYHTATGIEREKSNIRNNSERLLMQTAIASELAIFAADRETLENTARNILADPDIDAIQFYDDEQRLFPLSNSGKALKINTKELAHSRNYVYDNHWIFINAVYPNPISFSDTPETDTQILATTGATRKPVGWVVIAVNLEASQNRQMAIIRNNLMITSAILAVALWLALLFSRSVTTPIRKISEAIEQYSHNNYDHRIDEISGAEIGQLEQGINQLARQVGESQQQLQDSIIEVTDLWSHSVDDLRQKNIELRDATLEATKANQAKDDFLARMSHELRTPLTAIMGFLGILEKSDDPQVRKEYIDMIAATSEVLLSTINDILDFSKLNSGGFELEKETFNLELLLQNILDMHALSAYKKGIELNLLIDSDVPRQIETDPDKLGKAFNNIVANAIKFTENGDIVVFVSVEDDNIKSPLLSIEVKDSGQGIESEHLTQLFDPFYQVDNSTTRSHEGSGLGLAITRDFVTMLGGSIDAESELGKGTEVRFTLRATNREMPKVSTALPLRRAIIHESNNWSQRSWRNLLLKHTSHVTAIPAANELLETLDKTPDNSLLLLGHTPTATTQNDPGECHLQARLREIREHFRGPVLVAANDHSELDRVAIQKNFAPLLITRKPLTANRLQKAISILNSGTTDKDSGTTAEIEGPATGINTIRPMAEKRILIAEDNGFTLRLLNDLLSNAGANLTLTEDGEAAWQQVTDHAFDLILLDKRMPQLDGIALSQRIRQQHNPNSKTPIVLLTADRLDDHTLSTKEFKGISAVCYKPIEEETFFSTLRQLLKLTGSQKSLLQVDSKQLSGEIESQLRAIRAAADERNTELLAHHCHQLQGVMGMAGLRQLDQDLRYLNQAIEYRDWQRIANGVTALISTWEANLASQ